MTDNIDDLILDLLEWLGSSPRPYSEVLDAWRTSCPRLPVWEDANNRGFVDRHRVAGEGQFVSVSAAGAEHLRKNRFERVIDSNPNASDCPTLRPFGVGPPGQRGQLQTTIDLDIDLVHIRAGQIDGCGVCMSTDGGPMRSASVYRR